MPISQTIPLPTDNKKGKKAHTKQLLALLPLSLDAIVLIQQITKILLLIQFTNQSILHYIFRVVDEEMHDGFRNLVGDGFTHDVEVGGDEAAD